MTERQHVVGPTRRADTKGSGAYKPSRKSTPRTTFVSHRQGRRVLGPAIERKEKKTNRWDLEPVSRAPIDSSLGAETGFQGFVSQWAWNPVRRQGQESMCPDWQQTLGLKADLEVGLTRQHLDFLSGGQPTSRSRVFQSHGSTLMVDISLAFPS